MSWGVILLSVSWIRHWIMVLRCGTRKGLVTWVKRVHLTSHGWRSRMELSGLILRCIWIFSSETYFLSKIEHRSVVSCWYKVDKLACLTLGFLSQTHVVLISRRGSSVIKYISLCCWRPWVYFMRGLKRVDHGRTVWVFILLRSGVIGVNSSHHLSWPISHLRHHLSFFCLMVFYFSWISSLIVLLIRAILLVIWLVFCFQFHHLHHLLPTLSLKRSSRHSLASSSVLIRIRVLRGSLFHKDLNHWSSRPLSCSKLFFRFLNRALNSRLHFLQVRGFRLVRICLSHETASWHCARFRLLSCFFLLSEFFLLQFPIPCQTWIFLSSWQEIFVLLFSSGILRAIHGLHSWVLSGWNRELNGRFRALRRKGAILRRASLIFDEFLERGSSIEFLAAFPIMYFFDSAIDGVSHRYVILRAIHCDLRNIELVLFLSLSPSSHSELYR